MPRNSARSTTIIDKANAPATSGWAFLGNHDGTVQATVTGIGTVTATVVIEVSDDRIGPLTGFTITLSGTTLATDGSFIEPSWLYVRARLTSVTGTGAAVTVTLGV